MKDNLRGAATRFTVFAVVCAFFTFGIFAVFSQLRFQAEETYQAVFTNISGLRTDQFVRIAGVEVGKVKRTTIQPDTTVLVEFSAEPTVVLTSGTRVVIRYDDLIGGRFLALEEGAGSTRQLRPGETIPVTQTSPALDLDQLIGGFRPLFRALDPEQTNELTQELIKAFEGQGDSIDSFFTRTASLTSRLADRDQLVGQVIDNLNIVLGTLGDQGSQLGKGIDTLATLVATLAGRGEDIATSIAYTDAAAGSVTALLAAGREPFAKVVTETDRTAGIVVADHEYVDNLLRTLPDAYKILGRQGIYGDYFSFYLCDLVLKVNGKGGQPVYIKVAGQDTGRCTPK